MGESAPVLPSVLRLWALTINLWIAGVTAIFFFIRILGSNTAQRVIHSLTAH
jgi:hypothetical protein